MINYCVEQLNFINPRVRNVRHSARWKMSCRNPCVVGLMTICQSKEKRWKQADHVEMQHLQPLETKNSSSLTMKVIKALKSDEKFNGDSK